jgi:GTPase SAR1 family protein
LAINSNKLGNITAENDSGMLDDSFYETPDYRTLIESNDKIIVIGRRGTGKSALTYRLANDWSGNKHDKTKVFIISPEETQVIGLQPILNRFDSNFGLIKAAVRISWEACIYMKLLADFSSHHKFKKCQSCNEILTILKERYISEKNIAHNLRKVLHWALSKEETIEEAIAEMGDNLNVSLLKDCINEFVEDTNTEVKILIDCLDEGYQPDLKGVAYIAGIIQSTLNINSYFTRIRPLAFIRDNMSRAVSIKDPDYTRNIEGSELRLHWGESELLHMATLRLKHAFSIDKENDIRIWDSCTTGEVSKRVGFKKCLRLTLYRPRDLLALLNQAFFIASKRDSVRISEDDIQSTAKEISRVRLDDLIKEYSVIIPSSAELISIFNGFSATFSFTFIEGMLHEFINSTTTSRKSQSDMVFFDSPEELVKSLYGIGFLGIKDKESDAYSFSHDGKDSGLNISATTILHIHPCYHSSLNVKNVAYTDSEAEEIYDDYKIEVASLSQEQRNKKVGQLVSKINDIDTGAEDASEFESWCLDAISMIFAGDLQNIRTHPNKNSPQRRDIVATNASNDGVWKRIYDDYSTRTVVFEVKNFVDLKPDSYRQLASYLIDNHGRLGFIIYRSDKKEPNKENELIWVREIYWKQEPKKLIVLLSYKHLITFLEKRRNPQKHDAVEKLLIKILDNYHDLYLHERTSNKKIK